MNRNGRVTTRSLSEASNVQHVFGFVYMLGSKKAKSCITKEQLHAALKVAHPDTEIVEMYPTRECTHCKRTCSWVWARETTHFACRHCGTTYKNAAVYENLGTLHLNDSGKANKNMWNITPGMTEHDTITKKNGKLVPRHGRRRTAHEQNFWRNKRKVDDIGDLLCQNYETFRGAWFENILKRAKFLVQKVYRFVHNESNSDDHRQMPHGAAALAGACIFVANLEFESARNCMTMCTVPRIQEAAQQVRDHKSGHIARDVTPNKIVRYARMIFECGFTTVKIPHISSKTLKFKPESSSVEHARLAVLNSCSPARFHLPAKSPWGITIDESKHGLLCIKTVKTDGNAFKAGIRKGDYLFQLNKETIHHDSTPTKFQKQIQQIRLQHPEISIVELTIMRKKKNSV